MQYFSWRFGVSIGLAFAAIGVIAACGDDAATAPQSIRICNDQQALTASKYRGTMLPPKTLALTFDDGPGARTIELSHYLKSKGIPAAFFVNGKNLTPEGAPNGNGGAILQALVDDGHVIGNHTQTHADLTLCNQTQIVPEVEQTDALIAPFVPDERFMFRPPFGAYNDAAFNALEASAMHKYVGPIDWDIGSAWGVDRATDWDCWSTSGTSDPLVVDVKTCGDRYLAEIRAVGHGIVLLHDPYFIDNDPTKGGTVDMVKYILPILLNEGFGFVRVDMVPPIASALPPLKTPPAPPAGVAASGSPSNDAQNPAAAIAPSKGTQKTQNSSGENAPGGDSSGPCPASPQHAQHTQPMNSGESGLLRNP